MAHPHSAGWRSSDWHRLIINLHFHWCRLDFPPFLFFHIFSKKFKFISFYFYFLIFYYFLSFFFPYFLIFVSYYLIFFLFFLLYDSLLISFLLFVSPAGLFLIWVCVLVMSIDSKLMLEFIAWVMVIMLVDSTCQECMRVATCRAWISDFQRRAWGFPLACISSLFFLKLTGCCFLFDGTALGPTVILRVLTCLDKGPETRF